MGEDETLKWYLYYKCEYFNQKWHTTFFANDLYDKSGVGKFSTTKKIVRIVVVRHTYCICMYDIYDHLEAT